MFICSMFSVFLDSFCVVVFVGGVVGGAVGCVWVAGGGMACRVHVHVLVYWEVIMLVHCLWTQCGVE